MRASSALASSLGSAAGAFVAGWLAYSTLLRSRPQRAPQPASIPVPPLTPSPAVPLSPPNVGGTGAPPAPPALELLQRVQVTCAGVTFEGTINSIYIENGWARISLVDQMPDPVNPALWSWDDEGNSDGN
jgi:hypothetical protein